VAIKAFRFRLRPTTAQCTELDRTLEICRELYNAALQEARDAYRYAGVHRSCAKQQADLVEIKILRPDVASVYAQVLQDALKRLHRAFDAFFRRVRAGNRPGYPRFKGRDRYDSFTFPQVCRKGVLKSGGVELSISRA
jgi:putative transposase